MLNREGLLGNNDENPRRDLRAMNVTQDLGRASPMGSTADRGFPETGRASSRAEESGGSKLIVGPKITLRGVEITDCDTLVVEGRVEASMESRVVQIAETGVFTGTATMDMAEIWGEFEGELTARKQLTVYSTGRISGHIRYGKIRIEEGGEVSGDMSTLGPAAATHSESATKASSTPPRTAYELKQRPSKKSGKARSNRD